MDSALKELTKLQKLTSFKPSPSPSRSSISYLTASSFSSSGKKPTTGIIDSLDGLLAALRDVKERVEAGTASEEDVANVAKIVEERKREIDDRQKEIYATLGKVGKTLDKNLAALSPMLQKFTNPVPELEPLFDSPTAQEVLQRTIALHFFRTGQFNIAETFLNESDATIPEEIRSQFVDLHSVLMALRAGDINPALEWCHRNRLFLEDRGSPLEFHLHRSQFIRLLLSSPASNPQEAISYFRAKLLPLYLSYTAEIDRLAGCFIYLPLARLRNSPYADLARPELHQELEPMFSREYCMSLGMSRQVPLRVVGDIGGGGALARIEKGRKVMRERKSGWSQTDELPIEIPLPPENRYHSIFACPVSKEQSTAANPPMIISCGHVIARESLTKLSKAQGRVKCPYCPQESLLINALEVHF